MTNPCPGQDISTPYWKAGSAWGCGYHDGVDYAAPAGTDVVAAWSGTVVEAAYPTSFGSAFGRAVVIDHDPLPDGSAGLWGLYAHLSAENVSAGQRVETGQKLGDVGTTGNSSGNHLHFGVYGTPYWTSCGGKDPAPWIAAGTTSGGSVSGGNYDYEYLGKPGGTFTVTRSYKDLDQSEWSPPRSGWESTQVYLNVKPRFKSGKTHGAIRVRVMRENDDSTGHDTLPIDADDLDADGRLMLRYYYWEAGGAGDSTVVQLMCVGGLESAEISTRYTKRVTVVD